MSILLSLQKARNARPYFQKCPGNFTFRPITALYLYEKGDPDKGSSIISSNMCPNESHTEWGVDPGDYIIEAENDNGVEITIINQTVDEGTYHIVHIYDSNIQ